MYRVWNRLGGKADTKAFRVGFAMAFGLSAVLVLGLFIPVVSAGSDFLFTDPAGDVTRGDEPYSGKGAETVDILEVRLWERATDLVFHLVLKDLSKIEDELVHDGFHAQYAVSFKTKDGHAGYSTRALYGGKEYTSSENPLGLLDEGSWRFQLHDKKTDTWLKADGHVDGSTLVWTIPRSVVGVSDGTRMTDWSVQTWNSYAERDQYGDWATTKSVYIIGHGQEGGDEEEEDGAVRGKDGDDGQVAFAPGVAVGVLLLVVGAFLGTRRRG